MSIDSIDVFAPNLLAGKAAIITGGGSGIGAGIVKRFAKHGAKVALVGRTLSKLEAIAAEIASAGGTASCHACDVRDYPALEKAVNDAAEAHGRLDIVINNAAGNFLSPASKLSANGFKAVIDIDLGGTFNTSRAAYTHLAKQGGTIVNITATQAFVATPLQVHAGAAKAAIEKLTKDLALEWARDGIRVVSVAPGPVAGTEGMSRLAAPEVRSEFEKRVPVGRYATIEEIAGAVLFMVSPAAGFITGCSLLIDGGTSLTGAGPYMTMLERSREGAG